MQVHTMTYPANMQFCSSLGEDILPTRAARKDHLAVSPPQACRSGRPIQISLSQGTDTFPMSRNSDSHSRRAEKCIAGFSLLSSQDVLPPQQRFFVSEAISLCPTTRVANFKAEATPDAPLIFHRGVMRRSWRHKSGPDVRSTFRVLE